ncbi:MAG TPA: sulfotransferase [Caulobacteraceae bacterium]|jgi:tetratricopeptide (TPR) repeat protein|nr:sulfotransferase [Caulobacteraceae bacterium]
MVSVTPPSLAAAVEQAAALLGADPARAERQALALLRSVPADPRLRLIHGSARRRLGDPVAARAVLEPLAKAYPNAANTQYELGLTFAALGDAAAAVSALRRATALNRNLPDAWRALGDLLFLAGDVAGAERAFAEHERAAVQDPALRPAAEALFEGRLDQAEAMLRDQAARRPADVVAMRLLADVFARQERHGDAEIVLARCLELDPTFDGVRFAYANALFQQQKAIEAIPHAEALLARDPADPAYRNLLAACLGLVGENARAAEIYESLLRTYDKQPRIWLNYGHALRTIGRRDEAVAAYKRCITLAPGLGDAYWSLANLKVAVFTPADEAAMAAELERPGLPADDRLHLHYALGKALEDRGAYPASFDHYRRGAAIRRERAPYNPDELTQRVARSINLYTDEFFNRRRGWGSAAQDPIFIVGLPRSGSTLIEQILASHSAVEGTMELPDIGFIARGMGDGYPDALADLGAGRVAALGDGFIAATRGHRKLGRRLFIDKMPNNFHHLGLIHLILPGARIIDARRHPLGSCFSAFKQHFAQGQPFSYDLTDLGRYYRDYVELMAHFDAVLPGRIHRVIYEDLVQDTEGEVRRLLARCGLPFEDACLKFYENDRAVRTVSSEQVRRPIFRDGLDQWRNYEPWLGPLKAALGPALENWRG